MNFEAISSLMKNDLASVNGLIREHLRSSVELVNQISEHVLLGVGKQIRPMMVLLSAKAFHYEEPQAYKLAAIIELIHTATLLHDDVIDQAALRRGLETANQIWGNSASVLAGDFLYSRSFQMMVSLQNMEIMAVLAHTTNRISEGELLQLMHLHDATTTEADYFEIIARKTAILFQAASQLGALLAGAPVSMVSALKEYGLQVGMAFQLMDDLLDYNSTTETLGKELGKDLAEGKPTFPLIYALKHSQGPSLELLKEAVTGKTSPNLTQIQQIVQDSGALKAIAQLAQEAASKAQDCLQDLPASLYKEALAGIAHFAVTRSW